MWLHRQYQAETENIAHGKERQHIHEQPGQTHLEAPGQAQQGTEHLHKADDSQSRLGFTHNAINIRNTAAEQESGENPN